VQAPRSLWDPTYVETSWITRASTQGQPIALIPRLKKDVETHYPGTKIAITEYNYGAGDHVSGGIAQADVLGIFGREGLFAANWWSLGQGQKYVNAAFDLYLNFDGKGGRFGDTSVYAASGDVEATSIYASVDGSDASRVTLVMINRTNEPVEGHISVAHAQPLASADAYRFTGESPEIVHVKMPKLAQPNLLRYTLPPMSATAMRLTS
jgi:hypothetical protein